jgi:hypothetical protein
VVQSLCMEKKHHHAARVITSAEMCGIGAQQTSLPILDMR